MAGVAFSKIFTENNPETILVTGVDLIKSELEFLLRTERNTLFFGNGIGADLEQYLYLLNNRATYNLIKDDIEALIAKYGRVYLRRLEMSFDKMNKKLEIEIEVTTNGQENIKVPLVITGG